MSELELTADDIESLDKLATLVTPGGLGLPNADEADPDRAVLRLALTHFGAKGTDLLQNLRSIDAGADPERTLELLDERRPGLSALAVELLTARYYTSRPVWAALGYGGRKPRRETSEEVGYYLRDDLLAPVLQRGPIFNDVIDNKQDAN